MNWETIKTWPDSLVAEQKRTDVLGNTWWRWICMHCGQEFSSAAPCEYYQLDYHRKQILGLYGLAENHQAECY